MPLNLLLIHSPQQAGLASELIQQLQQEEKFGEVGSIELGRPATVSLVEAQVALVLLSEAFLKPENEDDAILDALLSRATEEGFLLAAVIASECDWEDSPYSGLPILPEARVACDRIAYWGSPQQAAIAVGSGLEDLLKDWEARKTDLKSYWVDRLKGGPSASRLALRLAWSVIPRRVKWGLSMVLALVLALLIWWGIS